MATSGAYDRRRRDATEDAQAGDRRSAELVERDLAVPAAAERRATSPLADAELTGVLDDRDHQTASVCTAMSKWTARWRRTTRSSSSNRAFIVGCARTAARIRKGSSDNLGCCLPLGIVQFVPESLDLGDVDLLDIGELRDPTLRRLHPLGDVPSDTGDLQLLDRVIPGWGG
jgi:hypothetical protein